MQTPNLKSLPVEQKVGQLFFIGIQGTAVDEATDELLRRVGPGGVCLFARNIREAKQTRQLLDSITTRVPNDPFLSLDQEGGLVDRLRRIVTPMPAPNRLPNKETAAEFGGLIAEIIRILGFNMNFAPVIDVVDEARSRTTNGLYSRTFGHSVDDVVSFADAFIKNLHERGCLECIKHFPGLGASEVDSHEELPLVNIPEAELLAVDIAPYKELLACGVVHAVMVAHAAFPNVGLQEMDQNGKLLPSSLSRNFVNELLRNQLQFDGLVITDDLEMGAIVKNYGIGEACKLAINAGVDMLAICAGVDSVNEGFEAVLESVRSGQITESRIDKSLDRIAAAKQLLHEPLSFDIGRLEELSAAIADLNNRLN